MTQLTLCFQGQTKVVRSQTTEKRYSDDMSYTEVQDSASIFFVPLPTVPKTALTHCISSGCHSKIGKGNGNPLQYSCLENPVDGGAG